MLPVIVLLMLSGCGEHLETGYGRREGLEAGASVNGTAVFGEMFEQAGHRVTSWHKLSPLLSKRADVIVWFPNDFKPPTAEVRDWLEIWLHEEPGRTLIYVGRDFDAAVWYWNKVQPNVPNEQATLAKEAATYAKTHYETGRQEIPDAEDCDWFTTDTQGKPRKIRGKNVLAGSDPEWVKDIDQTKLDIELHCRFVPSWMADELLVSNDPKTSQRDVLISRIDTPLDDTRIFVVTNGSFLLNASLVNHEHRKLAGKLVDAVGPPQKTVIFLESYHGGPPISNNELADRPPTGFEMWTTERVGVILFHLAAVGILFCFSRWPIFGPPRELPAAASSDFGKHIEAVAQLLKRSGDRAYALSRVLHYHQTTKPTSDHE